MDDASSNMFDEFDPAKGQASPAPAAPALDATAQQPNMFDEFDPAKQPQEPSAAGAFVHSAERSALPAAAGLAAIIPGAETGAAIGGGLGAFFGGVGAAPGAVVGGLIGGIAAPFMASSAVASAQDYALQQMPESWQDYLGQSQQQQASEAEKQPVASFLGGLVPYALTMKPSFNLATKALPANATVYQKILANPVTSRVFSGAVTGGMQLGQELGQGQQPNWTNDALATGFGVIFDRPNRIGESLMDMGGRSFRAVVGAPANENLPRETSAEPAPTVAQAGDAKVMGPGVTEDVFMGSHTQAPEAAMTAQDAARTEAAALRPQAPDVGSVARRMEPELFGQYDALAAQRNDLRTRLAQLGEPSDEEISTASQQRDALQAELDALVEGKGGYTGGPDARRLRAQIRDAQSQVDAVTARRDQFAAGEGTDTPEMSALRQQIMATDFQMRDLAPQVGAAYRRAADVAQTETIEPERGEVPAPVVGQQPLAGTPETTAAETPPQVPVEAQAAAIAQDVTRQMLAAGRPQAEAEAAGQLLGRHYVSRAARLGGAVTPDELYRRTAPSIRRARQNPPLMPTVERPNPVPPRAPAAAAPEIAPEITPAAPQAEIAQQPQEVATPEIAATPAPPAAPRTSELEAIDPRTIGVDAKRFQFKAGGDESGVTERLQGVEKWDPRLAGTSLVFRDAEGKNWIADGHQRLGLAKRLMEGGQDDIRLNAFVLDAAHGVTDADARAIAAIKNIAEGTGSAIDAAKVLRDAKETGIELPPLPPRSALVKDGKALAELSPDAFGMIVNEVVPAAQGAMVGRLVRDPAEQSEAIRLLASTKPENAQQAEMIVRDMLGSGTEMMTQQGGLFGEEAFASSVVLERAKIADEAIKQLRKDKQTFRTLVSESERIQGLGENVLDQRANTSRLTTDEKAADLLTQLAFRAGPVSDRLSAIARRFKSGELNRADAGREFLGALRGAIEEGVDTGADVGSTEPGTAGERDVEPPDPNQSEFFQGRKPAPWRPGDMLGEFETERGQEGFGQSLIPGVKPMTDAERIAAEANKPLKGGQAPAVKGGLFDVEGREDTAAQRELFQPAYHGTPHIFDKFDSSKIGTGEGAQAYGHGLYFASEKQVAQHYRRTLAGAPDIAFRGTPLRDIIGRTASPINEAMQNGHKILDHLDISKPPEGLDVPDYDKAVGVNSYRAMALREVLDGVRDSVQYGNKDIAGALDYEAQHWRGVAKDDLSAKMNVDAARASIRARIAEELQAKGGLDQVAPGRLYHVEVPEHHELMDWDKPLSEQPEGVREKLATLGIKVRPVPPIADREVASIFNRAMKQIKDATDEGDPIKVLDTRDVIDNDGALYQRTIDLMKRRGLNPDDEVSPGYWIAEQARDHIQAQLDNAKMTGEGIYHELARELGHSTPEERALVDRGQVSGDQLGQVVASRRLRDAGIPGHQYIGHESGKTNYVIYDDSRVNVTNYEQAKRGSITFTEGKKPIIKLFKEADASTFLHETGHQWLEELMGDAKHPAASDALKADADTVRKWLGMEGDTIATRQHEKFATGFEQYLREGVAPSPGLARVFAQFKSWLTSIYQTIKGLGAPINEDIRGVFDRLIEQEPQRAVVAPENAAEPTLHDIHEADAAEANPHHAEPIGDRISAERDAYVAQQPPEVQNELAAAAAEQQAADAATGTQPAGEGGAGPAAGGELGAPVGEPETQPAGGEGGGERGAVVSGSGAGVPESNGAGGAVAGEPGAGLRGNGPVAARAPGAHPLAPEPGNLFGPKQSPFLDLAGNIRVDNLTSDQDVAQAIHDAANANNDFIGDRRGVVTDGQVLDLADALGMTPDDLAKRHIGQAFNAEQVVAARKLLIQSATDLKTIMQRVADNGTDEDVMAFARAKARHQMIQGQVAGITAEAGRALRAFRSLAGQADAMGVNKFIKDATGKTLFQLREEAKLGAQLDTPEKVSKFVRDAQKRTFGTMVLEYWINGLISGPATHATYSIGNTLLSLQKVGPETAAAALIGALRRKMGRTGETVRMGEVGAQLSGMASSLPMATKAAIDSLRTGVTTRLPGEDAKALPFQPGSEFAPSVGIDEAMNYARVAPELFGMVRGIRDGLIAHGKLIGAGVPNAPFLGFRYSPLGAIPDIAVRGVPVVPVGTLARLPSRGVAAIHSFFRTVNYSMAKNALAYRSAAEAGLTGTAFDAHVANVRQNPSPEVMKAARGTATQLTLMGQGSEFVQALGKLTNAKILGFPVLKFVDPFVHIAGNIIDQSIVQRTPIGILSPELRADLMGKNGNVAQDTAMARMLVGTGLSIAFGTLAAQGLVSGSGPQDRNQAAMWRLAGNQPHSVRIGDTWYSIGRLGPLGMLSGVAADMYDVAHAASQGDLLLAASNLQHAFTQNILDESFMSGPAELIQALEDPGRYGESYLRNFASGFVPYSTAMQQMDRASDPYSRQARSIMDSIKNKIPGLSETLMPRRDIWGMPIANPGVLGPRGLSAIYTSQMSNDPVNLTLLNLGISPAQPDRKIRGVELTDQQYDTYQTLAGGMAKQRLNVIIGSRAFQSWPAQTQVDVINETISQSREAARNMVMARFPQIAVDATRAKLAPLKTP